MLVFVINSSWLLKKILSLSLQWSTWFDHECPNYIADTLNGRENLHQNTSHTRVPKYFATNTSVSYQISLTDKFPSLIQTSMFYRWTVCGRLKGQGAFNNITFKRNMIGSCVVKCKVTARLNSDSDIQLDDLGAETCENSVGDDVLCGYWEEEIFFQGRNSKKFC